MSSGIPGFGSFASGAAETVVAPGASQITSDDELEMALPEVPDEVEAGTEPLSEESVLPEAPQQPIPSPLPAPQLVASSSFKPPFNPSVPQDLSIIAELVESNQVVGSLPPVSMSAAEKRKLVEASIRAKTLALQSGKGKAKEDGEVDISVKQEELPAAGNPSAQSVVAEAGLDVADAHAEELHEMKPMTLEERDAIEVELDRLVGRPQQDEADDSDSESVSSSEFESDSSDDEDDEDKINGEGGPEGKEFVFSGSPAPSPRKRPMHFEVIDDDDEPVSSDPILSANEAPLPPVPQPPFLRLPEGEKLSLAGEVVSWMREKKVEVYWETQRRADQKAMENKEDAAGAEEESTMEDGAAISEVEAMEDGEVPEAPETAVKTSITPEHPRPTIKTAKLPQFASSGTIVLRAMQERPGQEGWLEEGSVVCFPDGHVLGFVSDTFGPLTSPFYSVRLPPPPFPLPGPSSLAPGSRLSYPINATYRSFVNMLAVQDPRFKGSDASNIHDEEIGEDEMEWSDDEMEAEAKRRRKNKRSDSRPSNFTNGNNGREAGGWAATGSASGSRRGSVSSSAHGLPVRPHFDYTPDEGTEAASYYGEEAYEEGVTEFDGDEAVSEAGSSASRRPPPMPYDLDEAGEVGHPRPAEGGGKRGREQRGGRGNNQGDRGRGRGQGRDRGGGRGGERGRGGRGGRPSDDRQTQDRQNGPTGDRGGRGGRVGRGGDRVAAGRGGRGGSDGRGGRGGGGSGRQSGVPAGLPPRPTFDQGAAQGSAEPHQPYGYQAEAPTPLRPPQVPQPTHGGFQPAQSYRPSAPPQSVGYGQPFHPGPSAGGVPQHNQPYPQHQHQHPQQPSYSYQSQPPQQQYAPPQQMQMQHAYQTGPPQHSQQYNYQQPPQPQQYQQQHTPGQDGPAINPRFAAQYQQMQMMSQLAAWGGAAQGQGQGGGAGGGGGGYGQGGYSG